MLTKDKLLSFLQCVDGSFPVPLSKKQDLSAFADKLMQSATVCYVEENDRICSAVAGYTENVIENKAYISIVATIPGEQGRGHAPRMIKEFISIAKDRGLDAVHLYTVQTNNAAVKMYTKLGFVKWIKEDETRPDDLHLIYYIKKEDEI